jgi:hypothetical protein
VHQIEATDRQIDGHVFELFGLTEEEIAILEVVARIFRHQQLRPARGWSPPLVVYFRYYFNYSIMCMAALESVRKMAAEIDSPTDLWRLPLRLTGDARGMAEKRDRRRSSHPHVLARQIREGWIGQESGPLRREAGIWSGDCGVRDRKLKMRPGG